MQLLSQRLFVQRAHSGGQANPSSTHGRQTYRAVSQPCASACSYLFVPTLVPQARAGLRPCSWTQQHNISGWTSTLLSTTCGRLVLLLLPIMSPGSNTPRQVLMQVATSRHPLVSVGFVHGCLGTVPVSRQPARRPTASDLGRRDLRCKACQRTPMHEQHAHRWFDHPITAPT